MDTKSKSTAKSKKEESTNRKKFTETKLKLDWVMLRFLNDQGTNLCFSNAAVSCLLNIPELKIAIKNIEDKTLGQFSICKELSRLAKLENETTATTDNLRTLVTKKCFENRQWTKSFDDNQQHDCAEFIRSLLEHFWSESVVPISLKDLAFGGLSQNTLSCVCGFEEELQLQPMPEIIPVQIHGESIQSCLDDYLSPENIEWNCPRCSNSKILKRTSVIVEPNIIILQLMRYKYDEVIKKV